MQPKIILFFTFLSLILQLISSSSQSNIGGFSIDLIHRFKSPKSPFYNASNSFPHNIRDFIGRSFIESPLVSAGGSYLMKVSVGTPPFDILAVADTGSDLIWTQCQPCESCFPQEAPPFDPRKSSTYKTVPCSSRPCEALDRPSCSKNGCHYSTSYGDQSYTSGDFALETFTFESSFPISKVAFGCGRDNQGTFSKETTGIVGLGGGPLSLVTQLGQTASGKFSYCLVPLSEKHNVSSGKLNFGSNAVVSGPGVVSTPLVLKSPATYYYLTLQSVSVGDSKLNFITNYSNVSSAKPVEEEGNIIIDSGTTLTFLPADFYFQVEDEMKSAIRADPVSAPPQPFNLCYKYEQGFDHLVPKTTFHFTGGADIILDATSTFLQVTDGLVCFLIVPSEQLAIYGNLSQMDFLVGYDLVNRKVSFKKTKCGSQ